MDGSRQHRRIALKADPSAQARLLELQAVDSATDRIAHRLRTLPAIARLAELELVLAGIEERIAVAEALLSDQQRAQVRIDGDVEQVRTRMTRDQQRLDSGEVSSPKELEQLAHEIESLRRRQSSLEDDELVIMEQVEVAEAEVRALREEERSAGVEQLEVREARADAQEKGAIEAAGLREQRAAHVLALPADLLGLYDKLRADGISVAAAILQRRTCQGCRIELASSELADATAADPDEVLRCESCRCILVRTAESGL